MKKLKYCFALENLNFAPTKEKFAEKCVPACPAFRKSVNPPFPQQTWLPYKSALSASLCNILSALGLT